MQVEVLGREVPAENQRRHTQVLVRNPGAERRLVEMQERAELIGGQLEQLFQQNVLKFENLLV